MSVLSRDVLEDSPLADLHTIASEIGIDGFRRLRKEDLVEAILGRQGGGAASPGGDADEAPARRPRARRAPRAAAAGDDAPAPRSRSRRDAADDADEAPAPRSRSRRAASDDAEERPRRSERSPRDAEERTIEGVVEVLPNGSAFVRVNAPDSSDDDAYVSAAQVRRCELVSGDRVAGPVRPPRRSERHPSMIRVETINGSSADEVAVGTPFDDLAAVFPTEAVALNVKDATLKEIADLAPIGLGSRVVVHGASGSGRSTTLRLLARDLKAVEGLELQVVLTGARPEEAAEWRADDLEPAAAVLLGQSPDAQAQAVERAIEAARRVASRGANAAVVIDALDQLSPAAARRALAAARNIDGGGSLTVIAAAPAPLGGETTVIALDYAVSRGARRPALDPQTSGTIRVAGIVGARKATTIVKNREKALASHVSASLVDEA